MDIIETKIDKNSEEYRQKFDSMKALVEDLRQELKKAAEDRSQKALDREKSSGKLPAMKKLELLLDKNTPFLEIAPLAAKDMYDGRIYRAGLLAGIGMVEGKECMISINDATIKGRFHVSLVCQKNAAPADHLNGKQAAGHQPD